MSKSLQVPEHIAIIMDGNGRWAKKRRLPRIAGHKRGAEVVKEIVRTCDKLGVKFLTLYTFSTENWKRPTKEINFLMHLLSFILNKEIKELKENNARLLTIGDISKLPKKAQVVIAQAKNETKNNTGLSLVLALNYGARTEIKDAAVALAQDIKQGKILSEKVTENIFAQYLYTAQIPDPDLLIRTSGEMRLSNFLLWQLSYSEFYITDKLWPEFDKEELKKAISVYQKRNRRFGAIESLAKNKK
ncbi:MAG: isoprenyl transferase [Candidatus Omnitrophota bacterium]